MRATVLLCVAALGAPCEAEQLRIISRTTIREIPQRGLVRLWVCPSGLVVIAGGTGELILVDGRQARVIYHRTLPELAELGGGTCDDRGRLYFGVLSPEAAFVRIYSLSPQPELKFERAFQTTGLIERLLAAGEDLYVVGLARVGSEYVFLRRFRLPEGLDLGSPPVKTRGGAGRAAIDYFAVQGSLLWHPRHQQVVYVPANPFELWRLDRNGKVITTHRPPLANFITAPPGASAGGRDFDLSDRVYNVAALPDGRMVAQILTGAARPKRATYLVVLDSDFRLTGEIPMEPQAGLLVGADAEGTLYFADLVMTGDSSLVKARLVP